MNPAVRPCGQQPQTGVDDRAPGLIRRWILFWFTPVDPIGLGRLRFLTGLLLLCWLLPLAGHEVDLFGLDGWFDQRAYSELARLPESSLQPASWSVLYLCGHNPGLLTIAYWLSVAVVVFYIAGLLPALTAILAWVAAISFTANPALAYDGDCFLTILTFYVMLGYVLQSLERIGGRRALPSAGFRGCSFACDGIVSRGSLGANIALRLLQVHFSIVMLVSGLHKLQFGDWWAGLALWYPLHPPFGTAIGRGGLESLHPALYTFLLSLADYAALGWQLGFPAFAWRREWRVVLLGGASIGWAAAAFIFELPLLGPAVLIGCLSYLQPAEWRKFQAWPGHLLKRCKGSAPRVEVNHRGNGLADRRRLRGVARG